MSLPTEWSTARTHPLPSQYASGTRLEPSKPSSTCGSGHRVRPLWSHQTEALNACKSLCGSPGLVIMPTGTGKSEIIKAVAIDWLQSGPNRVIIAVPNRELARQHRAGFYLHNRSNLIPTFCLQGYPLAKASRLIVTTYASLNKVTEYLRSARVPKSRLLLIADECHHVNRLATSYLELVSYFPSRIGFSATPWTLGNRKIFGTEPVYFLSLSEAQRLNLVCDYTIKIESDLRPEPGKAYQLYFVRASERFRGSIKATGVMHDDPRDGERRLKNDELIEQFRCGALSCLFVNRMLLEGFDCPQVKRIYIEKRTQSPLLAYQMFGRGLRNHKSQSLSVFVDTHEMGDLLCHALQMANDPMAEDQSWLEW